MASAKKGAKSAKKKTGTAPRVRQRREPVLPEYHPTVRQVQLMGECTVWACRAEELRRRGKIEEAKRALVMASRYLKRAKAIEARRLKTN